MCGISAVLTFDDTLSAQAQVDQTSSSAATAPQDGSQQSPCSEPGDVSLAKYRSELRKELEASLVQIAHRGPDSRNCWISPDATMGLGHVRLSIIDLSPAGQQPLSDEAETIHVVVNGELYDHDRIREELIQKGYSFKSFSDSEIVIGLYREHGLSFLSHLRGEFALCLYDSETRTLIAARDRYGIKPLFYTVFNNRLLVASEAKAFLSMGWKPQWDVTSLAQSGWMFDSRTIFKGVQKILPGHYLLCDSSGCVRTARYWDLDFPHKESKETRSVEEMITEVRQRLLESIRLRLRADVPVAVYLSGGLDSSIVAGMVSHLVAKRKAKNGTAAGTPNGIDEEESGPSSADGPFAKSLDVFTIRFPDSAAHDESSTAARTAEHIGARLHVVDMREEDFAERFEMATWHCEHPTADLNFIGKSKLSEVTTKAGFKVALTGEGSDETFAGYTIFEADFLREPDHSFSHPNEERRFSDKERQELLNTREGDAIEEALEKKVGIFAALSTEPISFKDAVVPRRMLHGTSACRWLAATSELPRGSFQSWVKEVVPVFDRVGTYARSIDGVVRDKMTSQWHPLHTALYTEVKGFFQNILLSSLGDRTEMSHSLEARTPFLDHYFTEYVNSLPPTVKIVKGDESAPLIEKWILREAGKPFITHEIYTRKKHPYTAPITFKPGGPLYNLVQQLLTKENVDRLGWASFEEVETYIQRGFVHGEVAYLRQAFVFAQLVSLSIRFDIPPARPLWK